MSRSVAERLRPAALALLLVWLLPAALPAETTSSAQATGVEMTAPVRRTLKQLEEQWLQWLVKNDRQSSDSGVEDLLATARQLGITRLPDLASGAIARALQAAEQKDFRRAHWSLSAADKLDPGRSDTAFAEASVARMEGDWTRVASSTFRGFGRLFSLPLERYLWFQSFLIWSLTLLLLTGVLFVAVQMAAKGGELYQDMTSLFGRWLPRPAAVAVTAVVLLWPLARPPGTHSRREPDRTHSPACVRPFSPESSFAELIANPSDPGPPARASGRDPGTGESARSTRPSARGRGGWSSPRGFHARGVC